MSSGTRLDQETLTKLLRLAWHARSRARILGRTSVGAAALGAGGGTWQGCNVEHQFRSHDIHAETNVIGTMVASGEQRLLAIAIVAERERFTPCGACLDWIWEFGGPDCLVVHQSNATADLVALTALELMPHYPR